MCSGGDERTQQAATTTSSARSLQSDHDAPKHYGTYQPDMASANGLPRSKVRGVARRGCTMAASARVWYGSDLDEEMARRQETSIEDRRMLSTTPPRVDSH